jgi:hypothetical protein
MARVHRARREVSPSTCSANVTDAQSGLRQKNGRTVSQITTDHTTGLTEDAALNYIAAITRLSLDT